MILSMASIAIGVSGMKTRKWTSLRKSGVVLAVALLCVTVPASVFGAPNDNRFTIVIYGTIGNPFWAKVVAGAKEAGKHLGAQVDIQFSGNDPIQQNNVIETAIANKTSGLGLVIDQDHAYDTNVTRARQLDIPVIAFNVDDTRGAQGSAREAFVGQDFKAAGYLIGERMIKKAGLKKGDRVACPVEHPEATYAVQRRAGVQHALDEVGAICEVINTGGVGLEDTLTKISQYLIGHPKTAAVVSLGSLPTEAAPQAIREAGLHIANGGFDLSKAIVQNIIDGKTEATIDQQPFYQGYLTLTMLYFAAKYGMTPASIDTGAAIIDKSNAQKALLFSDTVR